jgi:hypothetical protein
MKLHGDAQFSNRRRNVVRAVQIYPMAFVRSLRSGWASCTSAQAYRTPRMAASMQRFRGRQWRYWPVSPKQPLTRPSRLLHFRLFGHHERVVDFDTGYCTALSSLEWPNSSCTARRFFVRPYISDAFVPCGNGISRLLSDLELRWALRPRSRVRSASWMRMRIAQISFNRDGASWPTSFPFSQCSR